MCPVKPDMVKAQAGYGLMMCTVLEMKQRSMSVLTVDGAYKTAVIVKMRGFIAMVSLYAKAAMKETVTLSYSDTVQFLLI